MTAAQRSAASDGRLGVLLSSGYIAGGALAGIVIAFMAGVLTEFDKAIEAWAAHYNPLYSGPAADMLSVFPFVLLMAVLYWVGLERNKTSNKE
jgi:hypothetical protein